MITWSEQQEPCDECRYTHVVADTPLGKLYIEWKGWKDHDSPTCILPWGEHICGTDLPDAKNRVQTAWNVKVREVARHAYEQKAETKSSADYWADWLVDAVATATQDRRFLRGDPAEDTVATEALLLNGKKAMENLLRYREQKASE
jgi:hypothetical protein